MSGHRWSGWPGAWCLDCGCDDPFEVAEADGLWDLNEHGEPVFNPPVVVTECAEPGSKRFDPWYQLIGRNRDGNH